MFEGIGIPVASISLFIFSLCGVALHSSQIMNVEAINESMRCGCVMVIENFLSV